VSENALCAQELVAQVADLRCRYGRRSRLLRALLEALVSRITLLRLVGAMPEPGTWRRTGP
jgi:hypothetical protein